MAKMMYSQKWHQVNEYPLDYYELLYQYYACAGTRTPVTYYNLDLTNSVYDGDLMMGGSYETIGDMSGNLWKKVMLLPVYNFEQINYSMEAGEDGVGFKNIQTSFFIPSAYEIVPSIHDFVIYDQLELRDDPFKSENHLLEVVNLDKSSSSQVTFWKMTMKSSSKSKEDLEKQLSGNFTFVDYEKQIYRTSDAVNLIKQRVKNSDLGINNFYNNRIGLYGE